MGVCLEPGACASLPLTARPQPCMPGSPRPPATSPGLTHPGPGPGHPPCPAPEAPARPWSGLSSHPVLWPWGARRGNEVTGPPVRGTGLSVASLGRVCEWRRARSTVVGLLRHGVGWCPGSQSHHAPRLPRQQWTPFRRSPPSTTPSPAGQAGHGLRQQACCFHRDLAPPSVEPASRLSPHRASS